MEREAKDGTIYRQVGPDQWEMVARRAKNGQVYKALGNDQWELMQSPKDEIRSMADDLKGRGLMDIKPDEALQVAGYAGQAMDYPRGLIATGLAGAGGVAGKEDFKAALKGKAPSTSEYLERGGVPSGPTVPKDIPLIGGISTRDAGGFVADVVADPMTIGSKISKGLRPIGEGVSGLGKKMYKSGLKNVDKDLAVKGKGPVSDLLFNERKAGSMEKLANDAKDISKKALDERGKLYQQAADAGAVVDMAAAVKGARSKLKKLRENPGLRDTADRLEEFLNKYEGEGFVDIQSVSDWKTALYDSLPESAFANGKVKGALKDFERTLANDFKSAIEKSADSVAPGLGKKISAQNEKMGTVLGAKKSMDREVKKAVTPNNFTQVDAMFSGLGGLAGGLVGGPQGIGPGAAAAYGVKNAAKAMNTTGGRTRGGLLLHDIGRSGLIDDVARQGLIKTSKKKKNDEKRN